MPVTYIPPEPPKRILCLFDYGPNTMTGYGTVTRNLIPRLKKHFGDKLHLDICAVNYYGESFADYGGTVRMLSGKLNQNVVHIPDQFAQGDDFGRMQFMTMLRDENYDGIFIMQDLGIVASIIPILKMLYDQKIRAGKPGFKSMIYFPVDGLMHPKVINQSYDHKKLAEIAPDDRRHFDSPVINQVKELSFFDQVVTYTEYARREIIRHDPSLRPHIDILGHGIDTKEFYPLDPQEKREFRKDYFGTNSKKIIVGCINRNQPRKDIPTSIYGFIEAMEHYKAPENKSYFLYLHMNPDDPLGWKLRDVLSLTKLKEGVDYMFPKGGNKDLQVPTEMLNKIYNSLDMYLTTATGGGWELGVTEAMACKVPCIVPQHTSMAEIGADGRAIFMEEFLPSTIIQDNVKRFMCHYEEVGEKITELSKGIIAKEMWVSQMIENAYQWVTEQTWDNICEKWILYFSEVYEIN